MMLLALLLIPIVLGNLEPEQTFIPYREPKNFSNYHPLYFDPNDCLRSQYFHDYDGVRVQPEIISYRWFNNSFWANNQSKVIYDKQEVPINILIDWMPETKALYEFTMYRSKFVTKPNEMTLFNLGDAAFHTFLEKLTITFCGVEGLVNLKKHCSNSELEYTESNEWQNPLLFNSLRTIDFSYNRITFIDGNLFKFMKRLQVVNLSDNHIKEIYNIHDSFPIMSNFHYLYVGEITVLPCDVLYYIESLSMDVKKKITVKCKIKQAKCETCEFGCPYDNFLGRYMAVARKYKWIVNKSACIEKSKIIFFFVVFMYILLQ